MDKTQLKQVLDAHYKWLHGEDGGKRADLRYADLTGAMLTGADLTGADLTDTIIYWHMSCPSDGAFIGWKKARNIDDRDTFLHNP